MVFSSTIFLFLFLPVTLIGYYLLDRRFKNMFLLLVSLGFYAWGEPRFVLVMIGSIFINYLFGLLVVWRSSKLYQRIVLTVMVMANLSLFFVYKYLDFTITNVNTLLGSNFPLYHIALPIGISFFTFQAMSYVFDVYRGKGEVQKNPFNVALYVAFFPQLIAGPIVRYETVAAEIRSRKETVDDFVRGIQRFIVGLGKKVILSNSMAVLADRAFGYTDFSQLSVLLAWLGAVAYTLQIYFDFGGYSDMAIGLGLMFGFHFDENFNYPYIATSITDFWRRWHISLSTWFRDYVYIPLGGSRVPSCARHIFNLFVVWLLTGFWHGAAWHYVAWGMFYFVLLVAEKYAKLPQRAANAHVSWLYRFATLLLVVIGWVLFRAEGLKNAVAYLGSMFGVMGNPGADALSLFLLKDFFLFFVVACIAATPAMHLIGKKLADKPLAMIAQRVALLCMLIICIAYVINTSYDPFIYFNF